MPRWVAPTLIVLAALALVPFACVARSRAVRSALPRVHLVPDMDNQGRYKSQQQNALFADRRAMRPPVAGTVARGRLEEDAHLYRGLDGDDYAQGFPMPLTMELMRRGRQRYDIYCAPCHGLSGYGDGIVARRAEELEQGSWVPPAALHVEPTSTRRSGHLFNTITNGIRTMPAYSSQIPVEDRWAIVAYVHALQRSQGSTIEDVPAAERAGLR